MKILFKSPLLPKLIFRVRRISFILIIHVFLYAITGSNVIAQMFAINESNNVFVNREDSSQFIKGNNLLYDDLCNTPGGMTVTSTTVTIYFTITSKSCVIVR